MKFLLAFLVLFLVCAFAKSDEEKLEEDYVEDTLVFLKDCKNKDPLLCFKERALRYVQTFPSNMVIGGGFSVKANDGAVERSGRRYAEAQKLPEEPRAREEAIDKLLVDQILNYFSSHTIEFKMPESAIQEMQRSVEEGRKKRKKGGLLPLLILGKLKMATLGAIALKALALLAFKALVIAKIALTIIAIVGLKKLAESKHHSSTYEVVAHDDHHGHYRSFGQDLAYRAYKDADGNKNS